MVTAIVFVKFVSSLGGLPSDTKGLLCLAYTSCTKISLTIIHKSSLLGGLTRRPNRVVRKASGEVAVIVGCAEVGEAGEVVKAQSAPPVGEDRGSKLETTGNDSKSGTTTGAGSAVFSR